MRILTLPAELLEVLTSEHLVARNVLVELARVEHPATRERLAARAIAGGLTVRAIRDAEARSTRQVRPAAAVAIAFSYDQVETLAQALRCHRLLGRYPSKRERTRLVQLQHEVDAMLSDGMPASAGE